MRQTATQPGRVGVAGGGLTGYDDAGALDRAVAQALAEAGLSAAGETPFARIVPRGASVLLKPNWVYHRAIGRVTTA